MNKKKLVLELLSQSYLNSKILASFKRKYAKQSGVFLKNSEILSTYKKLVKKKLIKASKSFETVLRIKKVRSLSGIVAIAVLTKPYDCPGQCVYCPTQKNMPKSYLKDEPAVMRAKMANFDPYLQVQRRIRQLQETGHSTEKIELIVMGGTFSCLPDKYQKEFIKSCFDAANNKRSESLKKAKSLNEKAKNRIIGITLETRPDQINVNEIKKMRLLGATRVEIGIQSIYDDVLAKIKRGHLVKQSIKATKLLKDAGFKVCYHLMPNLPASSFKKDLAMFKTVFSNPDFKPDMLKIYPCVVVYQAKLYSWYKKGTFTPYDDSKLIKLLISIKKIVPPWVRINRLGRDIPIANIVAGTKLSNIRQVLQKKLKKENIKCQCIRCREIKQNKLMNDALIFKMKKYKASKGTEYFLQYTDKQEKLYALLRLRIPSLKTQKNHFLKTLNGAGIIRELHTYGKSIPISRKEDKAVQHIGLGKKLIHKAETICKKEGIKKIAVISGIGAREYYRKLGYTLSDTYMEKKL
ncbi:elongator complex protein 3 [Patescibacteria group bacterium]